MEIKPIAYIHNDFKTKFGLPRQSGRAQSLEGRIVFTPEFRNPDALRGIAEYSHIWLIFDFSMSHRDKWSPTVRPPRLGGNQRMGVFATRSPFRPNSIGLSSVKLEGIEETPEEGTVLLVSGADLLDMTPIYDIKPYLPSADSHPEARSGFAGSFTDYRLAVTVPDEFYKILPDNKLQTIIECLSEDPRPAYKEDSDHVYSMAFGDYDVRFKIAEMNCTVVGIDKLNE